jgi:hypothetical protein
MQTVVQCVGYAVRSRHSQNLERRAWRFDTVFGGVPATFQMVGLGTLLVAVSTRIRTWRGYIVFFPQRLGANGAPR